MLGNIGWREIMVVAVIAILLFGSRRIPELFKSVGRSIFEFRKSLREDPKERDEA